MRRLALALASMTPALPLEAQTIDTVLVSLGDGAAEVRQRLLPETGTVDVFAMRLDGQTLDVGEVEREGESLLDASLIAEGDAYRLEVASGAPIVLRYTVSGDIERIPLFVRGGRAELTVVREVEAAHLVRVEGDAAALSQIDLPTSLPRFGTSPEGALEVRLSSLPALVRLSQGGPFSFARVADLVVLALIVVGAIWTWRSARARGSTPEAGEPAGGGA